VAGEGLDALGRARDRVFVHCTPLGMRSGPSPTGSCFPDESLRAIKSRVGSPVVLDTVYNPVRTPLLIAAERAGWHIIDGVSMFVRQAALQSEAWTGCAFSPARAEQLVRAALAL
jgi:shikimate dehydrogenase